MSNCPQIASLLTVIISWVALLDFFFIMGRSRDESPIFVYVNDANRYRIG